MVDLSELKPKNPNHPEERNNTNLSGFVIFAVELGIHAQIALGYKLQSKHPNKKCLCQKHKILWHLSINW